MIFLTIFSCQYLNPLHSDKALTEKIEEEIRTNPGIVDLSKLADFEWDNMLILGPYSEIDKVETELNIDLENIRENGIEYDDRINLMIFLKDKKSIKIAELSRTVGDFLNSRQIIERKKARFFKTEFGQNKLVEK